MKCLFCHKGMAEGVSLFRVNAKGQPGIWACSKHIRQTDAAVDSDVASIVDALSARAPTPRSPPMSEKLSEEKRAPKTHTVKCVPPFFEDVWSGRKGLEVRLNDRDYREGDTIIQREYLPDAQEYTGRETMHRVGYVLRDYPALADNHVAFTLLPCAAREARPAVDREAVARVIGSYVVYDDKGGPDDETLHDVIGGDYVEATRRVYELTDRVLSLLSPAVAPPSRDNAGGGG